jgi:hypothetical protein
VPGRHYCKAVCMHHWMLDAADKCSLKHLKTTVRIQVMKWLSLMLTKALARSPSASSLQRSCKSEEFANFQQN